MARADVQNGGGKPASPDTSVQFNDGGAFGGFGSWDKTNKTLTIHNDLSSAVAVYLYLTKARGTGAITAGDDLGGHFFKGNDGTQLITSVAIKAVSTGTIGTSRVPSALEFWTSTDASPSVLTKRMTICENGYLCFPSALYISLASTVSYVFGTAYFSPVGETRNLGTSTTILWGDGYFNGTVYSAAASFGSPSYTATNRTSFDTKGFQTMYGDARPWYFREYDFIPLYRADILGDYPCPYTSSLFGDRALAYFYWAKSAGVYQNLQFSLTVPEGHDASQVLLYFYLNFTLNEESARGRNAVFFVSLWYANIQEDCDDAPDSFVEHHFELKSCSLRETPPWRDHTTDPTTGVAEIPVKAGAKIRGTIYRYFDHAEDDYEGQIVPLQIGFWARKSSIGEDSLRGLGH